jgi:hypothetical protein
MGRASKTKGSRFERLVCRQLSLWISGGRSEHLYWRSSQSGGRATTRAKKGDTTLHVQSGDIAAIDPEGHHFLDVFYVECKNYKSLKLDSLFYRTTGDLAKMWIKTREQAKLYGKQPLMIIKENGQKPLLLSLGGSEDSRDCVYACIAKLSIYVHSFDEVLATNPNSFIDAGEKANANARHGGLASDGSSEGRVSLDVSDGMAVGAKLLKPGDPRRSHRRKRLSL